MQLFVLTSRTPFTLATSAALSILFASTSLAADANAVAERIKALYAEQGGELSFASVKADGDNVILEGTKIKIAAVSDKETEIGDVTLENIEDVAGGGFKIGKVEIPDLDVAAASEADQEKDRVIIKGILMENLHLPSATATDPLDKIVFYDRMKIDQIDVGMPGTDGIAMKGLEVALTAPNKTEKVDYTWSIANIDTTFSDNAHNPLAPLNMNSFNGSVKSNGTWLPQTGDATLDTLEINATELGKINISGSIGGYDLAFLKAIQKTQEEMLKADADTSAASLALLKLSQQLSLQNMTIRFDNDSLTQKLLDYYAKLQGTDANTLVMQLQMMVPLLATQLKNPEFSQQLGAASNQFFSDPKSFSISASPDEPITFAAISATASADPTKLIQLLKLSVSANN